MLRIAFFSIYFRDYLRTSLNTILPFASHGWEHPSYNVGIPIKRHQFKPKDLMVVMVNRHYIQTLWNMWYSPTEQRTHTHTQKNTVIRIPMATIQVYIDITMSETCINNQGWFNMTETKLWFYTMRYTMHLQDRCMFIMCFRVDENARKIYVWIHIIT